jgi:hypothetical protein
MACALTQGNTLGCNDGFGGLKEIYLGNKEDYTYTVAAGVVTAITKTTAKRFYKYELVPFTADANFDSSGTRENQTSEVKQTISFVMNKLSSSLRNELIILQKAQVVAVVVDNNGSAWLYGYENGLHAANIKGATGKALKDRNGYEVALEGMEKETPLSVQFSLVASLETPGA